jgi:hypothetical protein
LLPFQVTTALRKNDLVTLEQCREAMIAEGASLLSDPRKPELRFATADQADEGVRRLVARLPESEPVWIVMKDGSATFDLPVQRN